MTIFCLFSAKPQTWRRISRHKNDSFIHIDSIVKVYVGLIKCSATKPRHQLSYGATFSGKFFFLLLGSASTTWQQFLSLDTIDFILVTQRFLHNFSETHETPLIIVASTFDSKVLCSRLKSGQAREKKMKTFTGVSLPEQLYAFQLALLNSLQVTWSWKKPVVNELREMKLSSEKHSTAT